MWLYYSCSRRWRDVFHRGVVCAQGVLAAFGGLRDVSLVVGCVGGVHLLPLYIRGAGLHEGVLVGYGIGVLVGYNCASCIQGRSDSIPTPIEASCSLAQQVVCVYPVWSRWPSLPSVRVTILS